MGDGQCSASFGIGIQFAKYGSVKLQHPLEFYGLFNKYTGTGAFYIAHLSENETWTNAAGTISGEPEGNFIEISPHPLLTHAISDTLAAVAEINYNLEDDRMAEWRVGATLQHTPRLNLFIDFAEIDVLLSRLMTYGFNYQLSRKCRAVAGDFSG